MITFDHVKSRAEQDAKARGYFLTPEEKLLGDLLEGLHENEERFGYPSCPCRISTGIYDLDRDIICPCDYRDPDVREYGACYCSLFVNQEIAEGKDEQEPIPERRPIEKQMAGLGLSQDNIELKEGGVVLNLFYCKQCGYVVFREEPPYVCPICRARREFFEKMHI